MYVALLTLCLALAAGLVLGGVRRHQRLPIAAGFTLAAATALFFGSLTFWGEMIWFAGLGYGERFWTAVAAEAGFALAGAAAAGGVVYLLTRGLRLRAAFGGRRLRFGASGLAAFAGGLWGWGSWERSLLFFHREPTGVTEPILGLDAGFYLFTLPFVDTLHALAVTVTGIAVAAALLSIAAELSLPPGVLVKMRAGRGLAVHPASLGAGEDAIPVLARTLAAFALVVAAGRLVAVAHLLYSRWGAVSGPGWTDVHVRLPALVLLAVLTAVAGLALLSGAVRRRLERLAMRRGAPVRYAGLAGLALPGLALAAVWMVALGLVPGVVQRFWVEPTEIGLEAPYIAHNIEFTRRGFGLDRVEEREFPAGRKFDAAVAARNGRLLAESRLWDWRALDEVYRQFQEIRLYYEFVDVDVDRYRIGDRVRQVMVSAREMEVDNLPVQSQTFVNRRFKYTHGYGLTMAPVAEFTPQGLPNLLIKNLPPESAAPELAVDRPQIYYGELTDGHVYVNTREAEFDYPSGDSNVTIHYPGQGGVELSSLWRRFVFGWMFDGTRFFLSDYPTPESRVMFHRQIRQRVARLAPFLSLDRDPYLVLAEGRLYWIIDAYTTSRYYPYSEPYSAREVVGVEEAGGTRALGSIAAPHLHGLNYVRNSVKAVVDAFEGTVDLYVFEPEDPLIQVWQKIFPELFQPATAMPPALADHVRYPDDFFLVQGLTYAKYHMSDPEVFYNQEDLWVRATEKYASRVQPVEPYYVMWQPPDAQGAIEPGDDRDLSFSNILPFTPKNRQVLIGWLAGLADPEDYGRLIAYQFPKQERVLGPQQVETKIDQDRFLSQQLTLWDQRGSRVIRGNVLAIPVEDTLLYVEPIYLQAETAAYPELRLVVLMHGDDLAYGESLAEALERLVGEGGQPAGAPVEAGAPLPDLPELPERLAEAAGAPATATGPPPDAETAALARQANRAFERYLELQAERRFAEAAVELERLGELLERLAGNG